MLGFTCLFFYAIDKKKEVQIEKELSGRRSAGKE